MTAVRAFALANFILQIALVAVLVYARFLSVKKNLEKHCAVMRIVVPVQLVAVGTVMGPSLIGYANSQALVPWFYTEVVIHAVFGLTIVGIWVFVNLAQMGVIKFQGRLQGIMRTAFFLWLASFAIGVHIYAKIWL